MFAALGLIGLGFAAASLVMAITREEVSEPTYVPKPEQIASAKSLAELDAYYNILGERYITGVIDREIYYALYLVYQARYCELLEVE